MREAWLPKRIVDLFLNKDIAPTMVTFPNDFISPFENRILTVREMARFQTFNDSVEFLRNVLQEVHNSRMEVPQYTQVGNALPLLLAKLIALEIKRVIQNSSNILTACRNHIFRYHYASYFHWLRSS